MRTRRKLNFREEFLLQSMRCCCNDPPKIPKSLQLKKAARTEFAWVALNTECQHLNPRQFRGSRQDFVLATSKNLQQKTSDFLKCTLIFISLTKIRECNRHRASELRHISRCQMFMLCPFCPVPETLPSDAGRNRVSIGKIVV